MTVRDPGYQPRRPASRLRRSLPALAAAAVLIGVAIPFGGGLLSSREPSPTAPVAIAGSPLPTSGPTTGPVATLPSATPAPTPAATPTPAPTPAVADVPIVPVTSFRAPESATGWADLTAITGGGGRYAGLVLVEADADAILATLRTDRAALGDRLVTVADSDAVAAHLAANRDHLGFLRAGDVGPGVRALAWGADALFGVDRVATLADWPLTATLGIDGTTGADAYDPAAAWTMVAGGDILIDRGVELAIRESRRGADFLFDGGTVEITGRCRDCSSFGWDLPYTRRTGNAGAVRELLTGADLAIANLENPAPDAFRFHARGTVFSMNPAHLPALARAGIDWVSLANNHIGDAGRNGILQTIEHVEAAGIAHGGAGVNRVAARTPSKFEVPGDVTVALLAYDAIASVYHAGPEKIGSAGLSERAVVADIEKAHTMGADVVIVYPHWGVEYRATPSASQRAIAHAAIDAGADMVIGNHAHWAAAVETYKGKPIWYALGNFVFDQTWSEHTMEGVLLELTFDGAELVQVNMRPHLILDRGQPNFLDPAGSGAFVMDQMFNASRGLLDW